MVNKIYIIYMRYIAGLLLEVKKVDLAPINRYVGYAPII